MARRPDPNARAALIAAARAEFSRRGLHGARIEDITAACGLAKGSFYSHFPTKESLFAELVRQFETGMEECYRSRRALTARFLSSGRLTRKDVVGASALYREFRALEVEEEVRGLELMWEFRDVVEVLISGAQGTPFEGAVWKLAEREAARVADEFRAQQKQGTCRTDVPPEIFGAMMVGTYLLLAQRLGAMRTKPDLHAWAGSIQALVLQGAGERGPAAPLAGSPLAPLRAVARKRARPSTRSAP